MKTLVENLTEQTQSLKETYLEMTKEWALKEFARNEERSHWTKEQWAKLAGVELIPLYPRHQDSPKGFPRGFYNTRLGRMIMREQDLVATTIRLGKDAFIARAEKNAITHYEGSIKKLAIRIQRKGLNEDTLELKSSRMGVNFETLITDGSQTVRAWTIIASGPIQRPHYRYLVK